MTTFARAPQGPASPHTPLLTRRALLLGAAATVAVACARPARSVALDPVAAPSAGGPPRVLWVDVPGARLELLDWGGPPNGGAGGGAPPPGPPVLLLHGINASAYLFGDLAPRLTPVARVYGLTRRGHGHSTNAAGGTAGAYDLPTLVADVVAALDRVAAETGARRAVLVGHSWAGHEMTALVELHPDRVAGLVYLDISFDPAALGRLRALPAPPAPTPGEADMASEPAMARWFARTYGRGWERAGAAWRADLHATSRFGPDGRYRGDVLGDAAQARMGRVAEADRFDAGPRDALRDLPAVAFFAVSAHYPERMLPPDASPAVRRQADAYQAAANAAAEAYAAGFRALFPRGRVVVVPEADHYLFLTHPALVAREVAALVQALVQAAQNR